MITLQFNSISDFWHMSLRILRYSMNLKLALVRDILKFIRVSTCDNFAFFCIPILFSLFFIIMFILIVSCCIVPCWMFIFDLFPVFYYYYRNPFLDFLTLFLYCWNLFFVPLYLLFTGAPLSWYPWTVVFHSFTVYFSFFIVLEGWILSCARIAFPDLFLMAGFLCRRRKFFKAQISLR